jgi:hypothetical protein
MSSDNSLFAIPNASVPAETNFENGRCPQCRTLVWNRKKFNMGVNVFFDTCPRCMPDCIVSKSPQEATQEIESLQRNFEDLTSTALVNSRDVRRIQMELQFLLIDIEEIGSTQGLDTSKYQPLADKLATSLDNGVGATYSDSSDSRDETPSVLEQIRELRSDMVEQLGRHAKGGSIGLYALVDILKQLEQVQNSVELPLPSFTEEVFGELQGEVDTLCLHLGDVENALMDIPAFSETSHNVSALRERYLRVTQDMGQRVISEQENEVLRRKIAEIERQHAAEVEALRAQLDTFMRTTVATNVVAVNADGSLEERERGRIREQETSSSVIEAEVVGTSVGNGNMSTMTAIAEPVAVNASESRRVVAPTGINRHDQRTAFHCSSIGTALDKIKQAESVSDILPIMTEHPTNARVQTSALKRLGNFTCDRKKINSRQHNAAINSGYEFQVDEQRRKIGSTKGIALILKALRKFPVDINVQTYGLFAIGNACRHNEENRSMFGDAGAIELILKAMCWFVEDIHLQRTGLFAMYTSSFKNTKNKATIRHQGGIPMLLRTMQRYQYDFEVQRNGLTCLGNLASKDTKNRLQICENDGIGIVFGAMRQFHQNDSIQDRACLTIAFLAKSPKIKTTLRNKGAITFVTKAATVIGDTKSSVVNALHALETNK